MFFYLGSGVYSWFRELGHSTLLTKKQLLYTGLIEVYRPQATAQKTQTFAMLVSKIGPSKASELVSNELDTHAHQFEGQWNENLAKAYAQNFTSEELASLASEGRHSKYVHKLSEKQGAVGESMQRMSSPILSAYVTTALTSAFSKISLK